jgi:hypothetical protein
MNKHVLDCQVSSPKSSMDVAVETGSEFNQPSPQWVNRKKFAAA